MPKCNMNHGRFPMASGGVAAAQKKFKIGATAPPYLHDAMRDVGIQEWVIDPKTRKRTSNPVVVKMIGLVDYGREPDASYKKQWSSINTPWCAFYVGARLMRRGWPSTRQGMARSYLKYGTQLSRSDDTQWQVGDIVVLWRGSRNDGVTGHVGFLVAWSSTRVTLLGGNQGDKVSYQDFPRARILGVARPKSMAKSGTLQGATVATVGTATSSAVSVALPNAPAAPQQLTQAPVLPVETVPPSIMDAPAAFPETGVQLPEAPLMAPAPAGMPDPNVVQDIARQTTEPLQMLATFKPYLLIVIAGITFAALGYVAYCRWRMRHDSSAT